MEEEKKSAVEKQEASSSMGVGCVFGAPLFSAAGVSLPCLERLKHPPTALLLCLRCTPNTTHIHTHTHTHTSLLLRPVRGQLGNAPRRAIACQTTTPSPAFSHPLLRQTRCVLQMLLTADFRLLPTRWPPLESRGSVTSTWHPAYFWLYALDHCSGRRGTHITI